MAEAYPGQFGAVLKGTTEDGRLLYVFSQTKMKQLDLCPERGRRTMLGLMPDQETDSTAMGRAVHAAIEDCLREVIAGRGPNNVDDMIEVACADFDEYMRADNARFVKYKQASTLHGQIGLILRCWWYTVLPNLKPVDVEVNFGPLTIHEDAERVIQVRGQIDYIDERYIGDWKTAGRPWDPHEHQRFDIQPTLYTLACDLDVDLPGRAEPWPWVWHVFIGPNGGYQMIETTRGPDDWAWLTHRMVIAAQMLEAQLPAWPKTDDHYLCSPKYCPVWSDCKGIYLGDKWPK